MQTRYAHGRNKLPAPVVTAETGGSISGNNATYYFWVKARNRVGYNVTSDPTAVTVANARRIRISAATFSTLASEGWVHIIVTVSTTNNYATSRVIYKQELFDSSQVNPVTPTDVLINQNFNLNGNAGSVELANAAALPTTELLNGFRVTLTSTGRVYEYKSVSTLPVDNVTVIAASVGQWVAVPSNSLRETDTNATKELFQVNASDLVAAPLPSILQSPVPIKYYIFNNDAVALNEGELQLNAYISDASIQATYYVKIIGYLNLTTFTLDTTGIDYVNTVVTLPTTKVRLSKPLPVGSAFVIEVTPNIQFTTSIVEGTYITLYPKLSPYTIITGVPDFGEPVADIAGAKALPTGTFKDRQVRYVESKRQLYGYDAESSAADNGDSVFAPAGNPPLGRWHALNTNIAAGSITPTMLSSSTLALISGNGIETTTNNINTASTFTINTDTATTDYFIVRTPTTGTTTIDITGTLANNTTRAVILELRQQAGLVQFANTISFPGGSLPLLSGNGKTDLFVLKLVKDGSGVTKKRAFMVQKDIG